MSLPRVSIMIITYNQRALVEETVRSALEQEYDDLEVVVADDGSTDGTAELLDALASEYPERLVALTGGPNLGITGNSNRGLRACTGALIAFQGGDDVLLPGKIQAQVAWMMEDERRVLSGHDVEYFRSEDDATICLHSDFVAMHDGQGARRFVEEGPPFAATSVMVRADALPAHGFDERLPTVSDGKLWIDVLAGGGLYGTVPGVWARYRRHEGNISATSRARCNTEAAMVFAIVEAEHPHLASACRVARARRYYTDGVRELLHGDVDDAQRALLLAMKTAPEYSWKVPVAAALALAPRPLRDRLLRRKRAQIEQTRVWS